MIIDDAARRFFADRNVLEQIDHLNVAIKAFVDDLAERRLKWLETELSMFARNHVPSWDYEWSRREDPRYMGIGWRGATDKWPSSLRVEFGWNARQTHGKMPTNPWIGVRSAAPARVKNKICQKVNHLFSEASKKDNDYAIFEYVKDWPNPNECHWIDLYSLIEDDGKGFLQPLVGQIGQIAAVLT